MKKMLKKQGMWLRSFATQIVGALTKLPRQEQGSTNPGYLDSIMNWFF